MWLRLALQAPWVRFLVLAAPLAVVWGVWTSLTSDSPSQSIWSTVIFALFFGVTVAGFLTYSGQATHKALVGAVAGLDKTERSQAIAAVTHGVAPADQTVRSSAIRLGAAYLRDKSADQLKRQERRSLMVIAVLVALCAAAAATNFNGDGLYYLALALVGAVVMPLGLLSTRRIQRNVALLAQDPTPR